MTTRKLPSRKKSTRLHKADAFAARSTSSALPDSLTSRLHVYGKGIVCDTESRGHSTPQGRNPLEIVVHESEGFIPLWDRETVLRWRFQERSLQFFETPDAAKAELRKLLGEAILAWGAAAPVKFTEREDAWDFEIAVRPADNCRLAGCVLASAFFPDAGQHELVIYPKLFEQSREEQIETLIHEIGHVFGLRHFFAQLRESQRSHIFGTHQPFTIMNYGPESTLTTEDKHDLSQLYRGAWTGELKHINGTPIRLVRPFHATGGHASGA